MKKIFQRPVIQPRRKQRISETLVYLFVWLLVFLVPIMGSKMLGEEHVNLGNIFISWRKISPYFLLFLINNTLLVPRLLLRHRYLFYILCDLAVIIAIFGIVDIYERNLVAGISDIETMIDNRKASFTDLAFQWNILLGIFMTGTDASIKLLYRAMSDEREMEELKHQNLQAELDYLKYQINPHFFMNTLNNIHALIDIDAEGAKDTVIELSKMMRYVLYDSEQQGISLQRDLQFLRNYIRLMRIRYPEDLDITVDCDERAAARISVPPLLLIVFVENAFKHGVASGHPSFIRIAVRPEGERVVCTVVNSKRPAPSRPGLGAHPAAAGVGLKNVRKRLDLIYGDAYGLDLDDGPDTYTVTLSIPQYHDEVHRH